MCGSADRKPSTISYSAQFHNDLTATDRSFTDAANKFDALLDKPLVNSPAMQVKRGSEIPILPNLPYSNRAEVIVHANTDDLASAPEGMRKLFLDLGIEAGDNLDIQVMLFRRDSAVVSGSHAERLYFVTLMPPVYKPFLLGVMFDSDKDWRFLRSGTPVDKPVPANMDNGSKRLHDIKRFYALLPKGVVENIYEEDGHRPETYEFKPHPFLAAIHSSAADWVTTLVDKRLAQ